MKTTFTINGEKVDIEAPEQSNLLWTLRDHLQLTGTKYGCGMAQCGACVVHLNGQPIRACVTPLRAVEGQQVTTIEGLGGVNGQALKDAWIEAQVPQCGYCQSGQIMQAATLLEKNNTPSREDIVQHMNSVLCRCGTYLRIIKAIELAASKLKDESSKSDE